MSTDRIITLHGEQELVQRAGHLFVASHEEFLVAATDLMTWSAGVNAAFREGKRPHVVPGLTLRKLYSRRALADPESLRRLRRIAASGIEVRISDGPIAREAIVIDRRTAILVGAPVRGVRAYTVVQAPEVVDGVRSLFRATWETATELADCAAPPPPLSEQARDTLRALSMRPHRRDRRPPPRRLPAHLPPPGRRPDGHPRRLLPLPGGPARPGPPPGGGQSRRSPVIPTPNANPLAGPSGTTASSPYGVRSDLA